MGDEEKQATSMGLLHQPHPASRGGCARALRDRGVLTDYRPPTTIRMTPVPLYTSYEEVWEAVQHLKAVIDNGEHLKYDSNQRGMF
jgi:kynureninase